MMYDTDSTEYAALEARTRFRYQLAAEQATARRARRPYLLAAYAIILGTAGAWLLSVL